MGQDSGSALFAHADHADNGRPDIRGCAGRIDTVGLEEVAHGIGGNQRGLRRRAVGGSCDLHRLQLRQPGELAIGIDSGGAGETDRRCWQEIGAVERRLYAADGIAAALPGTRLLKLPACGHSPHRDQPAAVIAACQGFLAGTPLSEETTR